MKKTPVLVPFLLMMATLFCVGAVAQEIENEEIGKVRHLSMAGV